MTTELSKQDAIDFRSCVQIVRKGMNTFREVGQALAKIRDEQWYKQSHKTFEAFCIAEFGFKRSHAYRLIEAAAVAETSPVGYKLETERQARKHLQEQRQEAAAVTDDDQADVVAVAQPLAEEASDPVGVSKPVELNRVAWWLDKLQEDWDEYATHYGDNATWMHARIAIEQFAISQGQE